MGRILLVAGAALLAVTAIIHGCGQSMVDGWIQGLSEKQKAAICLVWVTDSLSWLVVAAVWVGAAWKRGWLGPAALAAAIPALTAVGILAIEPAFFGGWMLVASVALAGAGLGITVRQQQPRPS